MITIPIKIKREDKVIMIKMLESANASSVDYSNLNVLIFYENYTELLSKLRASQHNDKSIRLNLVQVKFFTEFLTVYSQIGTYEMANASILTAQTQKEIQKKATVIRNF